MEVSQVPIECTDSCHVDIDKSFVIPIVSHLYLHDGIKNEKESQNVDFAKGITKYCKNEYCSNASNYHANSGDNNEGEKSLDEDTEREYKNKTLVSRLQNNDVTKDIEKNLPIMFKTENESKTKSHEGEGLLHTMDITTFTHETHADAIEEKIDGHSSEIRGNIRNNNLIVDEKLSKQDEQTRNCSIDMNESVQAYDMDVTSKPNEQMHPISPDLSMPKQNSWKDFIRISITKMNSLKDHPLLCCDLQDKLPIIYRSEVNIRFLGLEKLHSFDASKYEKIAKYLVAHKVLNKNQFIKVNRVTSEMLRKFHSKRYMKSLKNSRVVAKICEFPPIAVIPNSLLRWKLMKPMKYHVGGTIFAVEAALHYGWSINLGGGMHHAHADGGGGWCVYSDIPMALSILFQSNKISSAMIIDLDVHQSNGISRDHLKGIICSDPRKVYIMDVYSGRLWPRDHKAKAGCDLDVPLEAGISDLSYLSILAENLDIAFQSFKPDIVVYNAGTDILDIDPLGNFNISKDGVKLRDTMVFENCISRGTPIAMVTSGGYAKGSGHIIGESITHLISTLNLAEVTQNYNLLQNISKID